MKEKTAYSILRDAIVRFMETETAEEIGAVFQEACSNIHEIKTALEDTVEGLEDIAKEEGYQESEEEFRKKQIVATNVLNRDYIDQFDFFHDNFDIKQLKELRAAIDDSIAAHKEHAAMMRDEI